MAGISSTPAIVLAALGGGAGALTGALLGGGAPAAAAGALGAAAGVAAARFWRTEPATRTMARDEGPSNPSGPGLPAGQGRFVIDNVPLGVLLIDRQGQVHFANKAATALFGVRPPLPFPVSVLRAPRFLEAVERTLGGGPGGEVIFSLPRSETMIRATVQSLRHDGGETEALALLQDHTAAHRAAELHRDFVANASHELKTPLAAVSGLIETLEGHARDDPEATERFLKIMATETQRMAQLVQDLLSLNRIETNERVRPETPQPVIGIAREAAEALRAAAAENAMTLDLDPDDDTVRVPGDRDELHQLFSNLFENAIRYGEPGTPVGFRVRKNPEQRPDRIGLAVINQGEGIAREHLPRLTERFYRVSAKRSRAKGGTGLGLAICKHIVARHQGEMTIESRPGEGAVFTVWLPLATDDAVPDPFVPEAIPPG